MGPSGCIRYILHILDCLGQVNAGFIQVLYLGRAPRTKETLPDFREKCRVIRHSRVFRGLTVVNGPSGLGRHSLVSELRYTNTLEARVGYPTPLGGLMWSIGMWKP